MIASSSAFSSYLIGYYTKYFPGSFFVNYAILSVGDSVTMVYVAILSYYVKRVKNVIRLNLIAVIFFSVVYITFSDKYPILVPFGIFVLRVCLGSMPNYVYHMN